MKRFAALYAALDATTSTRDKLDALTTHFSAAPPEDAAWASYFLAGGKPRQTVPTRLLVEIARERAGLPEWLFDESYEAVGDLAETIAHVLPPAARASELGLTQWVEERVLTLRGASPDTLRTRLVEYWDELDWSGRFLLTKLIGGGFRVGVARQLVVRALADVAGVDHKLIAQRMVGWTDTRQPPNAARYLRLIAPSSPSSHGAQTAGETQDIDSEGATSAAAALSAQPADEAERALPYPFFLAHPLQAAPETLGDHAHWLAEWKWDGIRAQIVKRDGRVWIWSRGEDLITERFPEVVALGDALPDGYVIDGEILAWQPGAQAPLPFARLQPRITRKSLTKQVLADSPAAFLAYDLLEAHGADLRLTPLAERRTKLDALGESLAGTLARDLLRVSPLVDADSWSALAELRAESRKRGVEGLMLKERQSLYGVGRTKAAGTWWKWKIDPYAVDAVLVYAQRGHGRRASLYTDFTFAVWDEANGIRTLVPFAKAYSGLTDEEMREVDAIVRKTTVEKFGPVRSVTPTLVFEIGFEGIQASTRHKSGVAVRFPRMLRWRTDKHVDDADTLAMLKGFIDPTAQ
jgi:DNA ligase 1